MRVWKREGIAKLDWAIWTLTCFLAVGIFDRDQVGSVLRIIRERLRGAEVPDHTHESLVRCCGIFSVMRIIEEANARIKSEYQK